MLNILYKIYYGNNLVYFGRTHQKLEDRIRGHLFKSPGIKVLEIDKISKIEYAELDTEADMFVYEIYYINKYKPVFNRDDKACDSMTITLPELEFREWSTSLWSRWKDEIDKKEAAHNKEMSGKTKIQNESDKLEAMLERNEIGAGEYEKKKRVLLKEEADIKLAKGEITLSEYCRMLDLTKI